VFVQEPRLLSQVRRRRHIIAFGFAAVTSVSFLAYLCLLKLGSNVMSRPVSANSHFSWAIVASVIMVCLVIAISAAYVLVTHKWLDPLVRQLRRSVREA
jgi:uncharacterized membrane protein (DUF485 family)